MPRARRNQSDEVERLLKAGWTLATNADRAAGKIVTWRPPQPEFRYATLRQQEAIAIANRRQTFQGLGIDPMDVEPVLVKYCETCGMRYVARHTCESLFTKEKDEE